MSSMYMPNKTIPLILLAITSCDATAYIGPGLGAGTVGIAIGIIVSIFLALFAILWYPFKRIIKGKRSAPKKAENKTTDEKR